MASAGKLTVGDFIFYGSHFFVPSFSLRRPIDVCDCFTLYYYEFKALELIPEFLSITVYSCVGRL